MVVAGTTMLLVTTAEVGRWELSQVRPTSTCTVLHSNVLVASHSLDHCSRGPIMLHTVTGGAVRSSALVG